MKAIGWVQRRSVSSVRWIGRQPMRGLEVPYMHQVTSPIESFAFVTATSGMKLMILRGCDSIYYSLPCFPVVNVTRVSMARMCEDGRKNITFDGFVRPVLLDVTLPIIATPRVSFDIAIRKLYKEIRMNVDARCPLCSCKVWTLPPLQTRSLIFLTPTVLSSGIGLSMTDLNCH